MTLRTAYIAAFPILLCCAGLARAEGTFAYGKVGGRGASVGIGMVYDEHFAFRTGISGAGSATHDRDMGGNNYIAKFKPGASLEALLDWYPSAGGGLRVTGGLIYLGRLREDIKAIADATGSYNINNRRYAASAVGELSGKVSFNKFAPYLGIGWESGAPDKKGWRFSSDAGIMLLTGGRTTLSASGAAENAVLRQDVEAERSRVASESGNQRRGSLTLSLGYTF